MLSAFGLTGLTEDEADSGSGIQHMPVIELPRDLPGHITLFAAKVVPDGQPVASEYDFANELSPIGAFWCDRLDPDDPTSLGAALRAKGYDVIWIVEPEDATGQSKTPSAPPPGTVVTWAWLRGPHTVDIRLMEDGKAARHYQRDEGTFAGGSSDWTPSCAGS